MRTRTDGERNRAVAGRAGLLGLLLLCLCLAALSLGAGGTRPIMAENAENVAVTTALPAENAENVAAATTLPAESSFVAWPASGNPAEATYLRPFGAGGFVNSFLLKKEVSGYARDYYVNNYQFAYSLGEAQATEPDTTYDNDGRPCYFKGGENVALSEDGTQVVVTRLGPEQFLETGGSAVWGQGMHQAAAEVWDPIYTTANRNPYLAGARQFEAFMEDVYYNFKGAEGGETYNIGVPAVSGDPNTRRAYGQYGFRFQYGDLETPFFGAGFAYAERNIAFVALVSNAAESAARGQTVRTDSSFSYYLMRGGFYTQWASLCQRQIFLGAPVSNDDESFAKNGERFPAQRFERGWIYRDASGGYHAVFAAAEGDKFAVSPAGATEGGKIKVRLTPFEHYAFTELTVNGATVEVTAENARGLELEVNFAEDAGPIVTVAATVRETERRYVVQRYFFGGGAYIPDAPEPLYGDPGAALTAAAEPDRVHGGTVGDTNRANYYALKWDPAAADTVSAVDWSAAEPRLALYYRPARYVLFLTADGDTRPLFVAKVFDEDGESGLAAEQMPAVPAKPGYTARWDRESLANADFTADGAVVVKPVYAQILHEVTVTGGVIERVDGEAQPAETVSVLAPAGAKLVVAPVVPSGKVFLKWTVSGEGTLAPGTDGHVFTVGGAPAVLRAEFADRQFPVTVTGGTLVKIGDAETDANSADVAEGATITVRPDAAAGRRFAGWQGAALTDNGDGTWSATVRGELAIAASWEVAVTFAADKTTVETVWIAEGGSLAAADFPQVPAKTGYAGAWERTADLTAVGEPVTVNAVYTANRHRVALPDGCTGGGEFAYGATVTVRPPAGKTVKSWSGADGTLGEDGSFSFAMPDADVTLTVEYEAQGCGGALASAFPAGTLLLILAGTGALLLRRRRIGAISTKRN